MKALPTRSAIELAWVGVCLLALSLVLRHPVMFAWGSALLIGNAIARAVTLLNVARSRASGFEMLWSGESRISRIAVGETLTLSLEVRNRDARAVRFVRLFALSSPHLSVHLSPDRGEVPAGGRLAVEVQIRATRVGRHGIFGMSLDTQGAPGLYQVPLNFPVSYGIEALPKVYRGSGQLARGGRFRSQAETGRSGRLGQGSADLRQLRAYQPGDLLKQVAWKTSARRGRLFVRELYHEERDSVWLVLDASVEHWAGASGAAPLDLAISQLATVAEQYLRRGDRVGLGVLGRKRLVWLPPQKGVAQLIKILEAMSFNCDCREPARSSLDESDCAAIVFEHLRHTAPKPVLSALERAPAEQRLETLSRLAQEALNRAPFASIAIASEGAANSTPGALRRYLQAFGMDFPPRLEPDQPFTDAELLLALKDVLCARPRVSCVVLCSPVPSVESRRALLEGLSGHPRSGIEVRWLEMPSYVPVTEARQTPRQFTVDYAQRLLAAARLLQGRRELGARGVRFLGRGPKTQLTPRLQSAAPTGTS